MIIQIFLLRKRTIYINVFKPQIGLGNLLFSFQEKEIINILGNAELRETENNESIIRLFYFNKGIFAILNYNDDDYYLSIHADNIIIECISLTSIIEADILNFIKKYHSKIEIEYKFEKIFNKDVNETYYNFKNIGLSIWYDNEGVSDICIIKTTI